MKIFAVDIVEDFNEKCWTYSKTFLGMIYSQYNVHHIDMRVLFSIQAIIICFSQRSMFSIECQDIPTRLPANRTLTSRLQCCSVTRIIESGYCCSCCFTLYINEAGWILLFKIRQFNSINLSPNFNVARKIIESYFQCL